MRVSIAIGIKPDNLSRKANNNYLGIHNIITIHNHAPKKEEGYGSKWICSNIYS